ncbi:MAG TPA: class Ib ribonucleoside-diphosphate reductase assembly flavoprotein NrdI [Firmicutes bacterium]|nr:class Ib ribonucleoside-diphosphate reductase assembly flavoprotein NrdI [Bacillales bacterium]HJA40065.1 class Ib ribonucleoside-diphosphate reductase assembly flavoprotein NrdI [Bacillota bacterium]
MKVYFDSCTGNVARFSAHLPFPIEKIEEMTKSDEPYVLITYTTNFGQVPEKTEKFLKNNGHLLKGVVASGNKNWGTFYGKSGDIISEMYQVPLLHKFELSGTKRDQIIVKEKIKEIEHA